MNSHTDISKHLFYSAWVLTIIQMFRVLSSAFSTENLVTIVTITDAAFDCALILFGIGIVRLGMSFDRIRYWIPTIIFLFLGAIIDIIAIILSYSIDEILWDHEPLIFVRLVIMILYLASLAIGFIFLKFTIDQLVKKEIVERKGQFYLPAGILIISFPYLISWYGVYIRPLTFSMVWENITFYAFLFAAFLLILGFLGLSSTMKLLQQWSIEKEIEESEIELDESEREFDIKEEIEDVQ